MEVEVVGYGITRHRTGKDVESTLWVYDIVMPTHPVILTLKCYDEYTSKSWQEEWCWLGDHFQEPEPLMPKALAKKLRESMIRDIQTLFEKSSKR